MLFFFVCCVCTCKCLFFVCFLNILHNDNNKKWLVYRIKKQKKAVVVVLIIIICSSIFYNYGRSSFSSFFLCIYSWPAGWWSKCFFFVVIIVGKIGKNWFSKYTDTDYTYTVSILYISIHICRICVSMYFVVEIEFFSPNKEMPIQVTWLLASIKTCAKFCFKTLEKRWDLHTKIALLFLYIMLF